MDCNNIVLYSTGCPQCFMLKNKLKENNITFTECNDENIMEELGITRVPMLKVEDKLMSCVEAFNWIDGDCL